MRWKFESHPQYFTLHLSVINDAEHQEHAFDIHRNLALILGYLDLDYWLTPIKNTTRWNQNRISLYLRRLREDAIVELRSVKRTVLLDPTFKTNALREWAVRVSAGYGHSQTGRRQYLESCMQRSVVPYEEEDFINYSKSNVCSLNDVAHLMITSDWQQLCKRDFSNSIRHTSFSSQNSSSTVNHPEGCGEEVVKPLPKMMMCVPQHRHMWLVHEESAQRIYDRTRRTVSHQQCA